MMDDRKSEQVFGSLGNGQGAGAGQDPAAAGGPNGLAGDGSRPRRPVKRLDAILAAATQVIARDGYHNASMREIAHHAGVSPAGLYHYFPGKERLLFLIQFRTFSGLLTEVTAAVHGEPDPIEQLRRLIHVHVAFVAHDMAALKVCSHELDSLTGEAYDEARRVRWRYYETARSIVARILEQHRSPRSAALDVRIATMSLFGTLNWLYRWYDPGPHGRDRTPAGLANQIFSQFLDGLICRGETHAER